MDSSRFSDAGIHPLCRDRGLPPYSENLTTCQAQAFPLRDGTGITTADSAYLEDGYVAGKSTGFSRSQHSGLNEYWLPLPENEKKNAKMKSGATYKYHCIAMKFCTRGEECNTKKSNGVEKRSVHFEILPSLLNRPIIIYLLWQQVKAAEFTLIRWA